MQNLKNSALETKSMETKALAHNAEINGAFDEFMGAFSAFKEANDERLQKIEKHVGQDVLVTEKVERINSALDEQKRTLDSLILKNARPALNNNHNILADTEQKSAFNTYMRCGDEQKLRMFESKSHSYGSGPDGGYLVPYELEAEIGRRLAQISPIRSISSVRQVSSAVLKKPFSVDGPATGWVSETASRPQTETSKLAEMQFPTMEIYAMPAATSTLLDDAAVDVEQWISDEVEEAFAIQEGKAFISGDGVNKPMGFLSYDTVAEESWSWGKLGFVKSGNDAGLADTNPSDTLIELIYSLKSGYRQNASFVMNRKTQSQLRKIKDNDGNYLWQPPTSVGDKASFMGFALTEAEDMPDMQADSTPIAFGDFKRGYLIVDRVGIRILRDPYSAKPYILFYTTKRVGGGVQDFDAIKLLKCAA